jgi:uncharacterized lipoprotein YbaY/uncharacterized membrane protein
MRRHAVPLLALGLFLTAACQPPSATTGTRSAPADSQAQASIAGSVDYLEKMRLPEGSELRVQLIDNLLADTPNAILAQRNYPGMAGPRFDFELPYDPERLRVSGRYGLHAGLYGPDDELLFLTDTRVPVAPGNRQRVEFRLIRVGTPAPGASPVTGGEQRWQCGEIVLSTRFSGEDADLRLPGARHRMTHHPSASGASYRDADGNRFWMKGDAAMLALAGQETRNCGRTDRTSPWQEARDRGVALRATGNEPGWFVEVGGGGKPAMRLVLDYGQRVLWVAQARRLPSEGGSAGFSGEADDGTEVELRVRGEPCRDDMSGHPFPETAELRVAGQAYRGCAAWLRD